MLGQRRLVRTLVALAALALLGCSGSNLGAEDGGATSDGPVDVSLAEVGADTPEEQPTDATAEPPPSDTGGDDASDATAMSDAIDAGGAIDATDAPTDTPTADAPAEADAPAPTVTALVITPNYVTGAFQCGPQQATAIATYSDGSFADVSTQAAWSSSPTGVVSVSPGGIVTCVSAGLAQLSVTFAGLTATGDAVCNAGILVTLTVAPSTAGVVAGGTVQFSVIGYSSDGSLCDATRNATWQTGSPSVATIASGWNGGGLATALAAGSTTVSATLGPLSSGSSGGGSGTLQVIAVPDGGTSADAASPLTAIAVAPPSPTLIVGCPQPMTATSQDADGSTTDVTATAAWSASPTFIASVDSSGVLSCLAPGQATITASYGGLTGQARATCAEPAIDSVSVAPSAATIDAGDTLQYAASALYSINRQCDVTQAANWYSSDLAVASIGGGYSPPPLPDAGLATGLEAGTTQIRALIGGQTGTATLVVQ